MATWTEFEEAVPDLAAAGRRLIYRNGDGEGLLVTVRGNETPRAHPVNVGVVDGHLYTFVQAGSSKRRDLDEDGRYALHTHMDPQAPHEFLLRGRARPAQDHTLRARIAADWFFKVNDSYPLYELLIEQALLGERPTADDWPPIYSRWAE
jgi:dipeptidyl aminopeptidase/acylaminoacyl peptidase